jgi:hypothetical protein
LGTNLIYLVLVDEKGKVTTYQVSLSLSFFKQPELPEPSAILPPVENEKKAIVSAKIEEISPNGVVKIRFSSAMKTNVSLSDLAEALEMYIVPDSNWTKEEQNFNMSHLNFTFKVTEYNKDLMIIKLNFTNPLAISPLKQQDRLVWHVLDRKHFFISATELVDLHLNFTTLSGKIMKQLPDDLPSNSLYFSSELVIKIFGGTLGSAMFLNILFEGSLSELLGMIKALQLVYHLPIMSTVAPANVIVMWNILIPLVMFDLVEKIP